MTMKDLFFRFDGRIPRRVYIYSFLFLLALHIGGVFFWMYLNDVTITLQKSDDEKAVLLKNYEQYLEIIRFSLFSYVALLWPSLAIGVKRLHDINWSGRFFVALTVAFIALSFLVLNLILVTKDGSYQTLFTIYRLLELGYYAFIVIMMVFPGTKGPNKYGEPLY